MNSHIDFSQKNVTLITEVIKMIEIYQLEQLIAFHKYGTLSKASQVLHISQPSLSRTMQQLEKEFQVTLFDRHKNKITLNDNGIVAVENAKKVINEMNSMYDNVRNYNRIHNCINIGSSAPMPITILTEKFHKAFPDMDISSEINSTESLINGLQDDTYNIIILPYKPQLTEGIFVKKFLDEHLMFSLPKDHPKAKKETLYLSDIDGQNMILMPNLGFWQDIINKKMPNTRFITQTDRIAFETLIRASTLPCFATDLGLREFSYPDGRVFIPILDKEVNVSFYIAIKNSNKDKFLTALKWDKYK